MTCLGWTGLDQTGLDWTGLEEVRVVVVIWVVWPDEEQCAMSKRAAVRGLLLALARRGLARYGFDCTGTA